jgi:nucleoside-diphosphate-sugar epimerase
LARRLAAAEEALAAACEQRAIAWTLFRPTLIYGGGRDGNVSRVAALARRYRVVALPAASRGLRQPVHAEDLARAVVRALDAPVTHRRAYDLGGGSTLSYREMVEAVFRGVGRRPRILTLPRRLVRLLLRIRRLSPEIADRMDEDLSVDWSAAARDFGYAPRAFAYPDGELPVPIGR